MARTTGSESGETSEVVIALLQEMHEVGLKVLTCTDERGDWNDISRLLDYRASLYERIHHVVSAGLASSQAVAGAAKPNLNVPDVMIAAVIQQNEALHRHLSPQLDSVRDKLGAVQQTIQLRDTYDQFRQTPNRGIMLDQTR